MTTHRPSRIVCALLLALGVSSLSLFSTPANKAALEKHYDRFLARELARCTTCHLPSDNRNPESLDDFPHNLFGARLRAVGRELVREGKKKDLDVRLSRVASEDADGDGIDNETELLLGSNPGDATVAPAKEDLAQGSARRAEFAKFLTSYRWQPFERVQRPEVPGAGKKQSRETGFTIRNPIDAFVAAEHQARGLKPRPEASKEILLRRVYLDLIGLSPTPEELAAFERDRSKDAYEKVVDRLLADPRHGERWARHWMDVWRYSDWAGWSGGNQIRDSKPHIWRWRDWIVESVNADKGYDRVLLEMLAADELAPEDTNALRATGFLVRNYKMLSREQWLEDTVKHTSQAFLGLTVGCAKCHNHMTDPISQEEYYEMRAIFEPHQVRTDRLPGNTNLFELGLVRTFDVASNPPTYFLVRGDERKPDTNRIMKPGVPRSLGGALEVQPVSLPWIAGHPDKRDFVYDDVRAAAEKAVAEAKKKLSSAKTNDAAKATVPEHELALAIAEKRQAALEAVIVAERLENSGRRGSMEWKIAASNAVVRQRATALAEAKLSRFNAARAENDARKKAEDAADELAQATNEVQQVTAGKSEPLKSKKDAAEKTAKALKEAEKKLADAAKALAKAEESLNAAPDTGYKRRATDDYPTNSTGRRLAFARWVASTNNPLTARVAANQIWLRHFGQGLVPNPADFGRAAKPPSHPQLLDWLASEFMTPNVPPASRWPFGKKARQDAAGTAWSMKRLHRLIVTSSTYRMASTPDDRNAQLDPDNVYLWRMNSRRMEAELVRDNLLHVTGLLDPAMGGPDIDHMLGLKSKRRSLYLRQAAEKEVEFLKIFDGPAVTECYLRRPTVVPQQALALANSEITVNAAKALVKSLADSAGDEQFARRAFERVLGRHPTADELALCVGFLKKPSGDAAPERARENLALVLLNHNDFVTVR